MFQLESKKDRLSLICLLGPFLGLWIAFWMIPSLVGIDLSLRDAGFDSSKESALFSFTQTGNSSYIGIGNYLSLLDDRKFWKSLLNSSLYISGSLLIILPLSFVLAICLRDLGRRMQAILLFCLMIPGLAMPSVLSNLFYLFFHGREGVLNQLLIIPLGFDPIHWMMDPNFILLSMILQCVWRWTGIVTLYFLCGLSGIPSWQYEVVKMEGLGTISKFRYLWFPNLGNLFLFAAVFLTVEGLASFSGAYVMLGGSGGILDSGLLFVTYLYQVAFPGGSGRFDFPTAAAMSVLVVPLVALVLFGILRIRRSDSVE